MGSSDLDAHTLGSRGAAGNQLSCSLPSGANKPIVEMAREAQLMGTPINVQSALMKQPNAQQLRSLRLSALARDNRAVAELNTHLSNSPDYLVEELMTRHGWPAHEALCAVQQLQEEALRGTSDQQAS